MSRALAGLAVMLLLSSCGLSLQDLPAPGGTGYRITAVFSDAGRLPMGGLVRLGQAQVGRVTGIGAKDFRAVVELGIDHDVRLPAGTTARLELASPLGEEFVILEPPSTSDGPQLGDGAMIPIEQTSRGPDIENALAAVGTLLNGSGLDQARTIVTELNTALHGREQQGRELLERLEQVLGSLAERRAEINSLIDSVHATSRQLAGERDTVDAALTQIRPAIDTLLAERERFSALLGNTAALSNTTAGLLDETGDSLTRQVEQFRPVLKDLQSLDGSLGNTVQSLHGFMGLLQQAVPGDYLLFNGTLDVPGTVVQLLNPGAPMPPPGQGGVGEILRGGTR